MLATMDCRIRHRAGRLLAALAVWGTVTGAAELPPLEPADLEFFESQVRPLLVAHCAECHSAEAGDPEGGLSFDSRADFFAAAGVAVAGKPEQSLLVEVVRYEGSLQMPPDGKLPPAAIAIFEEWVRRGLPWPDDGKAASIGQFDIAARKAEHWCWQPPRRSPPPEVKDAAWCRGDIDRFVRARLEAAGLAPAPEAERAVLARRAAEILTGLPADPADVERVVAAADPAAFEAYVDKLLASPQFGERFARHWLDVVRFAETRGHEFDFPIPNAWRYRDWVVDAFNEDLPYDRFIREQIAGDLVADPRLDAAGANRSVVGTGFWYLGEEVHSPVDILQDDADRTDNRVDTFGKAFLGLALGCARCHDHKFDAISAADYYAIAGMLVSSSYRQVPFESLEHNRAVADEAAGIAAESRGKLLPLVADLLAGRPAEDLAGLLPAQEALSKLAADREALAARAAAEIQVADYTQGAAATPLVCDAAAWRLTAAGDPVVVPAAEGSPARVELAPTSVARSDAVWSETKTTGSKDPGSIGSVDRAGRVLRTPKVRIDQGILWHRVRGNLQIFTTVDSHVMINGPLYGGTVMKVDTKGQWQWIRQDLRRDIAWDAPHVVHVEYAAIAGAAEVAEVVAAAEEPRREDPLAVALLAAGSDPAGAAKAMAAAALAGCRTGEDLGPAAAALLARLLAAPAIDWSAGPAKHLADEATAAEAMLAAAFARAKLESATAPAILDGNGIDQHVLLKGSAARPGSLAARRFLEAIDGPEQPAWPGDSSGRLQLADRVLDPGNPLTARVAVNRIWHHLFGRGLVPTTDNFGKLGEPAADPLAQALLDTLAVRFMEEGWSVKWLLREIVTSSTWRMSSARDPAAVERDPLNLLFHHYPLRRLEGEAIRDKILAVSGRLDPKLGGPGVDAFLTEFHEGRGRPGSGPLDGAGRRSLYTTIRRNFLPGFLVTFDLPVPFQAMGRRNVTNVPAQSLVMMNDPFVAEQAKAWAKRVLAEADRSPEARIEDMYLAAFARPPAADETAAAVEFLALQTRAHGGDFAKDPRQEAAWADLAHAVFNAKEFIFVP
jgi:hypothetical protein